MRFPNAYAGVKKIFTAEILGLIAVILLLVAAVMALVAKGGAEQGVDEAVVVGGIGAAALGLPALVLMVITFILNIVGLNAGAKDEPKFRTALTWVIIGIVASVVSGLNVSWLQGACETLGNLANILITIYVVQAIVSLSEKKMDEGMKAKGKRLLTIILVVYALATIAQVLGDFVVTGKVGAILAVVALVLGIVQYVLYLSYLSKAKKMLAA